MKNLVIREELQNLLPHLSESEYAGLEADIVANGCLSAIVVWGDVIVDGHNRYEICQKHGISFEVRRMEFASMDDARFWAWTHQENRRNLTMYQRGELALLFKPMLVAKGKENMSLGGCKKAFDQEGLQISGDLPNGGIRVDKALAKQAGISHDTMHKVEFLDKHADEETKENLRQGKTKINREYKRVKETVADPKPKKPRTKKPKAETPVAEPPEEPKPAETPPSRKVPCIEELNYIPRTTLKDIRQDKPEHLLRNLASHFRKGYIPDLVLEAMYFLLEYEGEKVTIPLAAEIAKQFLKPKRK